MISETMKKIRTRIRTSKSMTRETRTELLSLLSRLESEISRLSRASPDHAESIAGFIDRSTHEATRKDKNPKLLSLSLKGLAESVKGFEESHPRLIEDINYISSELANMGI